MQYQFTRYQYVNYIEFKNLEPLKNVHQIQYFTEIVVSGTFTKKEYRYSWDQITWTNWNTLTQSNLAGITFREEPDFYLEVRYNRASMTAGNIQSWYLYFDSNVIALAGTIDSSIDADYLKGQGPEYYLNSANHFGPYPGIKAYNIYDASSAGPYSHKEDTSTGTELYFKGIQGGRGVVVSDSPNNQIVIDVSIEGAAYFENPAPVLTTVGGILKDDTFFDPKKSFAETMDQMFYPLINPELNSPYNTFSSDANSLYEVDETLNINFEAAFDRGEIFIQSNFQDYRSGSPTNYYYNSPIDGSISTPIDSSSLIDNQNINYTIVSGLQSWENIVSYSEGPQPKDSKGNDYNIPLADGSTSPKLVTIEGVYPLFATSVDISTLTKEPLRSMVNANNIVIDLSPETGGFRQEFYIPIAWTNSRPLTGIESFNTFNQKWTYQGGTQISSLDFWTLSAEDLTIQGNLISYTKYTYNSSERGTMKIKLNF